MTHRTAAPAESNETSGKGRGLFGGAVAIRGASCGSKESGARSGGRLGSLLAALVLVVCALALTAVPASASTLAVTPVTVTNILGGSAHFSGELTTGEVGVDGGYQYATFEYSTDGVNWNEFDFRGPFDANGGTHEVEDDLTGLKADTKYFARLKGFNSVDPDVFSPLPYTEFETLPVAEPAILTIADASEVAYTTALDTGKIERAANSDPTSYVTCNFEFVTDQQFTDNQNNSRPAFEGASQAGCEPENPVSAAGEPSVEANLSGLVPSTKYHLRLGVSNAGGGESKEAANTFTTLAVPVPDVSALEATSAQLSAKINPLAPVPDPAFEVSWHFECAPECLGLESGTIAPDNNAHTVTANTASLQPNTSYEVTLIATNKGGSVTAGPISFKTDAPAPLVQTLGSGNVQADSASLAARINPQNSPVKYQFEWGETSAYGNMSPVTAEPLGAADNAFHFVASPLFGLNPATTYHYRITATNTQTGQQTTGQDRSFTTAPTPEPPAICPNETSRVGPSADLPNCRAYEWVTPDSGGTFIVAGLGLNNAGALADGSALEYGAIEAPGSAESNESTGIVAVATRGSTGWSSRTVNPPVRVQQSTDSTSIVGAISRDFSESVAITPQPLAGAESPGGGVNFYLHRPDGTFVPLSRKGNGPLGSQPRGCCAASGDFSHIYFAPPVRQLDSEDPVNGGNTYVWSNGDLKLLGILPGAGDVPAPNGGILPAGAQALPSMSTDGEYALFVEGTDSPEGAPQPLGGPLFLRKHDQETVEVSAPQLTTPDPGAPTEARSVGVNASGSKVLFVSHAELTDGANTGESGDARNYQGSDLYSYDVASEKLTDLTIDDDPADAATGANVQLVLTASPDGSYVYFVARGDLAPGGISGERNLYVWHAGAIDFIAPAAGLILEEGGEHERAGPFYVTPDGEHAAFLSKVGITGYDNVNPDTGEPMSELFKYAYKGATECVSCRPSGVAPTSDTAVSGRVLSDNGTRAFFQTSDALLPQASGGLNRVYEYESGALHLLTPADSQVDDALIDASASGNDVFVETTEELGPEPTGGVSAIYDARVNADTFKLTSPVCQAEACRGASTTPPQIPGAASATLVAPLKIVVPGSKSVKGSKVQLRVVVPAGGEVMVSGNGLKRASKRSSEAGSVTITIALKPGANKTRLVKGFKTKAKILFKSSSGETSSGEVSLAFQAPAKKKGGK